QWRDKATRLGVGRRPDWMRFDLPEALDAQAYQQRQRVTTTIPDDKKRCMVGQIGRIIRAEKVEGSFDTDMNWGLAATVFFAGYFALLIACICMQTTHNIAASQARQNQQSEKEHHQFFAHSIPFV